LAQAQETILFKDGEHNLMIEGKGLTEQVDYQKISFRDMHDFREEELFRPIPRGADGKALLVQGRATLQGVSPTPTRRAQLPEIRDSTRGLSDDFRFALFDISEKYHYTPGEAFWQAGDRPMTENAEPQMGWSFRYHADNSLKIMAGTTGLEPAASAVTGP
jgi:hypothetical protein